jgi:DMSO reductase family type II enzyme heme b subunit
LLGDGGGPAADFLDPRPRDFTLGTFKFRSTQSGELPLDVDLFRTVSRGLSGTAMQAFDKDIIKSGLSEDQRWAVIAYIKTFAIEFEDEELDPVKRGKVVALPANRAPFDADSIAKGKKVFEKAKCWECHGKLGRGDGQEAFDREDDWGFPIRIRNVTHPWKIKAGAEVEDIYMRFSTGISGTPMPSFAKALNEEDRWYLANYIKSLQHEMTQHQVLKALPTEGEVPGAADDALWQQAEPMDIRLAGQVIAAPRWQNAGIELVSVKAIYNDSDIAFLLVWDDAFKDVTYDAEQELDVAELRKVGNFNSYVAANDMVPRQLEIFRDSVALQFPVKLREGTKKPHFMRGDSSQPVQLWVWKADLDAEGERAVEEAIARGWKQQPKAQAPEQQQVDSTAVWDQGRWSVVMKRARITEDRNDVQFVAGKFIPMSMNAWDGSNGEHGLIMSLSSWYYVILETATPISVYLYAVLAMLLTGALGYWLMRKVEREAGATA